MQQANISLMLGGDRGQIVHKYAISPAEVTILRAVHGVEAVHEIEIIKGKIERSDREELEHLAAIYGQATDGENNNIMRTLFPGAGAKLPKNFAELGIQEDFYKTDRAAVNYFPELEDDADDALEAEVLRKAEEEEAARLAAEEKKAAAKEKADKAAADKAAKAEADKADKAAADKAAADKLDADSKKSDSAGKANIMD